MSNYLYHLVAKNFNLINTVQPFLPSVFEPLPEFDLLLEEVENSQPSNVTTEETEPERASEAEKFSFDTVQLIETSHKQAIEINRDVTHFQSPQVASSELSYPQLQPKPVTIAPTPNNMLSIVDNMSLTPVSVVETNTSASIPVIQQQQHPGTELQSLQGMETTRSVSSPQAQKLLSLELSNHHTPEEAMVNAPASNRVKSIVDNKPLTPASVVKTNTSTSIPVIQQQQHPGTELQSLQGMETTRSVSSCQAQKSISLELSNHHTPEEAMVNTPASNRVKTIVDITPLTPASVVKTNTSTSIPVIQQQQHPGTELQSLQGMETTRSVSSCQAQKSISLELSNHHTPEEAMVNAPASNRVKTIVDNKPLTPASVVKTNTSASIPVIQQQQHPGTELQSLQGMETTRSVSSPQVQKSISLELSNHHTPEEAMVNAPASNRVMPIVDNKPLTPGLLIKTNTSTSIPVIQQQQHPGTELQSLQGMETTRSVSSPQVQKSISLELSNHHTPEEVVVNTPASDGVMPIVDNKPLTPASVVKTNTSASIPVIQQQQHPGTELQSLRSLEKTQRVSSPQVQKLICLELSDHHIPEEVVVNAPVSNRVKTIVDITPLTPALVVKTNTSTSIPVIQQQQRPGTELQSLQAIETTRSVSSPQAQKLISLELSNHHTPEEAMVNAPASDQAKTIVDITPLTPASVVKTNTSTSIPVIQQQQHPLAELQSLQAKEKTRSVSSSPQSQKLINKEISYIQPQPEPVTIEQSAAPSQAIASIIDRMSPNPYMQPLIPAIAIQTNVTLPPSVAEPQGKLASDVPGIQRRFAYQEVSSKQPPLTDVSPEPFFFETQSLTKLAVDDIPSSMTSQQLTQLNAYSETVLTPTPALNPSTTVTSVQPQVSFSSSHLSEFHEGIVSSPVDNLILLQNPTSNPSAYGGKGNGVRSSYFRHLDESDIRPLSQSINNNVTEKSLSVIATSSKEDQQRSRENLETPSVVQVTIGRLEIRATPPPAPPPSRKPCPTPSVMSLDEYLRRRAQRR